MQGLNQIIIYPHRLTLKLKILTRPDTLTSSSLGSTVAKKFKLWRFVKCFKLGNQINSQGYLGGVTSLDEPERTLTKLELS